MAQDSFFARAFDTPSVQRVQIIQSLNQQRANQGQSRQNNRGQSPLNYGQNGFSANQGQFGIVPYADFVVEPAAPKKASPLEAMYSERIVEELKQYGYDIFNNNVADVPANYDEDGKRQSNSPPNIPSGVVHDDFVVNIGDEIEVIVTGQRTTRQIKRINANGMLIVEDFPPIPAAGRTIEQIRVSLSTAAHSQYNTDIYVSLATVRQIGVLVIGHVDRPGRQTLTVFHTVLDALSQAGGITKTGSLRQIKLVRDGRTNMIDLYGLMMHGNTAMDLNLRDGDRIVVSPLGPTVAVAGEVKRPGIYELLPSVQGMYHDPSRKSERLSLNDMLELGGGVLAPGKNRFLKLGINGRGQENVDDVQDAFAPLFNDGSILMVSKGEAKRKGTVELVGHTRRPGMHALGHNPNLSSLLSSEDVLGEDVYPLIGVIERWDRELLSRHLFDFPVRLVISGDYDRRLNDGDVVHLFSHEQIKNLSAGIVAPDEDEREGNPAVRNEIQPVSLEYGSRVEYGSRYEDEDDEEVFITDDLLISFLKERASFVRGAVRSPGAYPVSHGTTLQSVLAVAGGLALEANTNNIELTSASNSAGYNEARRGTTRRLSIDLNETRPSDVLVAAGDAVRVKQRFKKIEDQSVLIIGEVQYPGRYDLVPGDRVSDLLERAGGLTRQAYPDGAIFSRESERKAEEMRFKSQARAIQRSIAQALESDDDKVNAGKIAEARALAAELEQAQALGRITVEVDPAVLTVEPELDMLLQQGDRIYVPKRSLTVRVNGEVLSPASLQFRESKKPLDYVHQAGGFTFHADKDRTFVLYPDGSAQPLEIGMWNYNPVFIPPGSTIVVPRDPEPFDFIESAKDISQILSNLAITAIFIDDVLDDDF